MDTPRSKSVRAMDAGDRISGFPDELLHHAMSFLPARDAVRTCVLSRRWRHLWVSMRCLSVDAGDFIDQIGFINFVTSILLSRGCTPLDSFRLNANGPGIFLENFRGTAYLWICHALRSNVRTLSIINHELKEEEEGESEDEEIPDDFWIGHCPFRSLYLKKLHLHGVYIDKSFAKNLFSGCTALEDLDMINCEILATEFSSATLKRLSIDYHGFCHSPWSYEYIVINMPSLVSLHIGALFMAILPLVDVQSLITASVCLDNQMATFADACNILGALSSVKNLELLFPVIVKWEYSLQSVIQLCPVEFANLTTLSISDWCLHDNCKVLLYILEHSTNLVELTLKLTMESFGSKHLKSSRSIAAVDSTCKETMRYFHCEKLKKVLIIYPHGDRRVGRLVTILLTRIISPPEISIKPSSGISWDAAYFINKWKPSG